MIRRLIIAGLLCALTACTPAPSECPREGGIGGTGGCIPNEQPNS